MRLSKNYTVLLSNCVLYLVCCNKADKQQDKEPRVSVYQQWLIYKSDNKKSTSPVNNLRFKKWKEQKTSVE